MAVFALNSFAQPPPLPSDPPPAPTPPPELLVTNVYRLVPVTSSTNAAPRHIKPVRRWQKPCPECGCVCISTNILWNGSHTEPPGTIVRDGTVIFECSGEQFREAFHEAVKTSPPMIELPPK
jgi:hypothetical protein